MSLKNSLKSGDKRKIANVLCSRSLEQRLKIAAAYESSFGRSLIEEIKSKTSGNVKQLFTSLLIPIPELYCHQFYKTKKDSILENFAVAVLSLSTNIFDGEDGDETVLIEIMCTMSNAEIRKICATYQHMFGKRLEQRIREDKNGNFKRLMIILSAGSRDESVTIDLKAAKSDAEVLQKHFSKIITDEKPIIDLLSTRSYAQIMLISQEYKKLTRSSLEAAVKKNISGNLKEALLAIIRISNNRSNCYARRINKAINNHLIDNRSLSRLIVVRSEIDLMDIKEEFTRIFRKPLKSCFKKDITGSYGHALLTLIGDN